MSVERLRNAGLKLAAEMFLRLVAASPENMKEWAPLAKLLLQAERNESWRRIKEEENGIRERSLELAREKFQYAVTEKARKEAPEPEETEMTELEENKMVNNIRRGMFGENIPGVLPETEYELAHPEILEAREKEAYARQMAIYARKREEREQEARREKEAAAARAQAIENERLKDMEKRSEGVVVENEGTNQVETSQPWSHDHGHEEPVGPVEEGVYYPGGGK